MGSLNEGAANYAPSRGDGTFRVPGELGAAVGVRGVHAEDLNGDGLTDLIVISRGGIVSVLLSSDD